MGYVFQSRKSKLKQGRILGIDRYRLKLWTRNTCLKANDSVLNEQQDLEGQKD